MSAVHRSLSLLLSALALAQLFALGGCASKPGSVGSGDLKDRVTASDEPDSSKRARLRLELASLYFSRGQYAVALDQVKLSIAADPTQVEAFNLRGLIYASLDDEKLAEESFRRAVQLGPKDVDTLQNYGWFLCQQKRYTESIATFRQLLALPQAAENSRTWLTLGICQAGAGQLDEAQRALERAQALDPTNPAATVNLAEVLYRKRDFERARNLMRGVNAVPAVVSPQTLWLAIRAEHQLRNWPAVDSLGASLQARFPESAESKLFEKGRFNE